MSGSPYVDDPSIVILSGSQIPGNVVAIKGADRGFKWTVQEGTSSSGATNVFKGAKIAETILVTVEVVDDAGYQEVVAYRAYIAPLKIGGKPPTFAIDNCLINFNEIKKVSIALIAQPDMTPGLKTIFVFTFTEVNESVAAKTGPADAAKKDGTAGGASGVDPYTAALQAEAAAARKELAGA